MQLKHVEQQYPTIHDAPQFPYSFCLEHSVPSEVFPPFGSWHGVGGVGGDGGDGDGDGGGDGGGELHLAGSEPLFVW